MTFSTKDLQTNVHEIGVEMDMIVFHALNVKYHHSWHEKNVMTKTNDRTKDINKEV